MKMIIPTALFLFLTLALFAQTDRGVSFDYNKYSIRGSYMMPKVPNGTAVLIIPGSGPTNRDCNSHIFKSNTYKFLASFFAENGYTSLRYDKLGVGASVPGKEEKDMLFYDNVDVAKAAYNFLLEREEIEKVIVLGHSEGSLVGMVLCNELKAEKFISLAGVAFSADKILATQFASIPDEKLRNEANAILDSLVQGKQVEKVNPLLYSIFRPWVQNYMISWIAYDPITEMGRLSLPVLVLQGDNDIQVETKNADELAMANPLAQKVVLNNITHVLKMGPRDREANIGSYQSENVDIDDAVKKALLEFLEQD